MKKIVLISVMLFMFVFGCSSATAVTVTVPPTSTIYPSNLPLPTSTIPTKRPTVTTPKTTYILETGNCAWSVSAEGLNGNDPKTDLCETTERKQIDLGVNEFLTITSHDDSGIFQFYCALFKSDGTFIMADLDNLATGEVECGPFLEMAPFSTQTPLVAPTLANPELTTDKVAGVWLVGSEVAVGQWRASGDCYAVTRSKEGEQMDMAAGNRSIISVPSNAYTVEFVSYPGTCTWSYLGN